jgi:neutral ceramidase
VEQVARGAGPLSAGFAEASLRPPDPVPIAGFAKLQWPSEGDRDPVAARALVVSEPGCSVALVSAELLVVPSALSRAVEKRVDDLDLDLVLIAATHTHAGPGGFWHDALAERIATGPYDPRIFEFMVDRIAEVIRQAHAAQEPALLSVARAQATPLANNRAGAKVDGRLLTLRFARAAGPPVAELVTFAAHPTVLGMKNRRLSGDWPGYVMRGRKVPTLFFQGAVGDQSVHLPGGAHIRRPENYARAVLARIEGLSHDAMDPWPELELATAATVLPAPELGASPTVLKRVARNLLHDWFPDRARVTALRIGSALLLAVPGEPVAAVASEWRAGAGDGAEVVALAGDYLGYIETSERMAENAGETHRTYYGPELAARLGAALQAASTALRESE